MKANLFPLLDNAFFRRGEVYTNFVQRRIDLGAAI
jgi:hypothetical protein